MATLVTKAELKTFIHHSGTNDDDQLDMIIENVEAALQHELGFKFQTTTVSQTEYFDPNKTIFTNFAPIRTLTSVKQDTTRAWAADTALIEDTDFFVYVDRGKIKLQNVLTDTGLLSLQVVYDGGFANLAALPLQHRRAILVQCAFEFKNKDSLGGSSVSFGAGASYSKSGLFQFVPAVTQFIEREKRMRF